jgi:[CysO sulfur-carrier protein]-S-L-cysteine hydrolase
MITIPKPFYDEMLSHAHEEYPNECCGLLAGRGNNVSRVYRMTNTHHSPVSYFMDPKEQFSVFREMREEGNDLIAIFHSHPNTQAYPSNTDVGLAYYPDALYIIISLQGGDPVVNAYRIIDATITPEEFSVQ